MDQILEKLFESVPKVRLLRLFMHNQDRYFTFREIVERTQVKPSAARSALSKLVKITLVREKKIIVKSEGQKAALSPKKKKPEKQRKINAFIVNPDFWFLTELRDLVIKSSVASRKRLTRQVKTLGKVKLAAISGIFLNNDRSRTDLLIVGDDIGKRKVENLLIQLESELGKSISYTLMDTDEFKYRMNMYDRFLRDVFEFPHEKLINAILK